MSLNPVVPETALQPLIEAALNKQARIDRVCVERNQKQANADLIMAAENYRTIFCKILGEPLVDALSLRYHLCDEIEEGIYVGEFTFRGHTFLLTPDFFPVPERYVTFWYRNRANTYWDHRTVEDRQSILITIASAVKTLESTPSAEIVTQDSEQPYQVVTDIAPQQLGSVLNRLTEDGLEILPPVLRYDDQQQPVYDVIGRRVVPCQ